MKKKFSKYWIKSKQPRKQRKYRVNAPLHIKRKLVSANLDKELRKKYGRRSFPLRKGDSIKIMIGEFKRRTGKISVVDLKKLRIAVEGLQRTKKDGTKINVWFNPSNLQIKELNLDDKKRKQAIERGKKSVTPKESSGQKSSSSDKTQDSIKIKENKENKK